MVTEKRDCAKSEPPAINASTKNFDFIGFHPPCTLMMQAACHPAVVQNQRVLRPQRLQPRPDTTTRWFLATIFIFFTRRKIFIRRRLSISNPEMSPELEVETAP